MATCASCGNTILFGGERVDGLRFCDFDCRAKGNLIVAAHRLPSDFVNSRVLEVHQGACSICGGAGPVDVHMCYRVWSALIVTRWSSRALVSCRTCGVRTQLSSALFSLALGWWGFPWGPIFTPLQVGRNLVGVLWAPRASEPSDKLETAVRMSIASGSDSTT